MAKHRLKEEGQGYKKAATVMVLSSGMMVLADAITDLPVLPIDQTQPLPIPPQETPRVETPSVAMDMALETQVSPTIIQPTTQAPVTTQPTTTTVKQTTKAPVVQKPASPSVDTSIIGIARSWLGRNIPYLFGGATLRGMDCSHFVWEVLKQAGYNVPYRNSFALKAWTIPISKANARPGDLVFWPGHVGFYAGNNQTIDHGSGIGPKLRSLWGTPTFGRIP